MGKLRPVNSHFWVDGYIADLTPNQKLVFLYLLTCPACNLAGVYEISYRQIAFDTGLKTGDVSAIVDKMQTDKKLLYVNGFVILVNHSKNQKLNVSMQVSRDNIINDLPAVVRLQYDAIKSMVEQDADTMPHDTDTMNDGGDQPPPPPPADEPKKTLEQRQAMFRGEVFTMENVVKFGRPMLQSFFDYWSEPNRSKTKMAMELKPTWLLAGRLATWHGKEVKHKKGGGDTNAHQIYKGQ